MTKMQDIFLRAHTVVLDNQDQPKKRKSRRKSKDVKWPKFALVFDCESRTDTSQELTFGFYRILELQGRVYELLEEGALYADNLPQHELAILSDFMRTAETEIKSFPPRFPLYSQSKFMTEVFYKFARKGALLVGFHIGYDLTRLARKWGKGHRDEWSVILSQYPDGNENVNHPRVLIDPIDSKKAFIRFRSEWVPKKGHTKRSEIRESNFVDLRTTLWSLFNQPLSLKNALELEAFKKYDLPKKIDHTPSGQVTLEEIRYARQDVKCTAALLNAVKQEFDLHPILVSPHRAYSPASMAKGYLQAMNIIPPAQKFQVPDYIQGIAMETYMGGRAETRTRHVEVPVVPVDFTSQYPTTCALLGLWDILTAESLSFDDATEDVRDLLHSISLGSCFNRFLWPDFRFFALVKPQGEIFPVRTPYNGTTVNIGNNYFTSNRPIWVAGPDLIAAKILTGRVPHIEKAIRVVGHGKQPGMQKVNLRGMVEIDPYKDDLFKRVIEQRKLNKVNAELYYWLKIFANSIYGFFVEINPEATSEREPVRVKVYSGEDYFIPQKRYPIIEKQGTWYAPYLASLITSGGRLLLALLERCVTDRGGVYAWADTDALAIVSSKDGGSLAQVPGCENKRMLSWNEVDEIVHKFESLNPYDRKAVPGSVLNLVDENYIDSDPKKPRRQLLGFSISAKRYVAYEREGDDITIINPKAHGLGYLYPPIDSPKQWDEEHNAPKWIYEFWECLLRIALSLKPKNPAWLKRPQMMRMTVTTQSVLKRLHGWEGFRPYNFFLLPILANCGYPANVDPDHFTLVTSFESDQIKWADAVCINIADPEDKNPYRLTTDFASPDYGTRAVVDTYENLLYQYLQHPESKSTAPDGSSSGADTRGLLGRAHIIAGEFCRIGKESDRRWEEGDDLESLLYEPIRYDRERVRNNHDALVTPSERLIRQIRKIGIRELVRTRCGRRILEKICRREPVGSSVLSEYERKIREYKMNLKSA